MARHRKIANSKIAQVYQSKACNIGATCAALGIDRKTLLNWRHNSPELEQMLDEAEESLIDFSESKLMEQINSGNLTASREGTVIVWKILPLLWIKIPQRQS